MRTRFLALLALAPLVSCAAPDPSSGAVEIPAATPAPPAMQTLTPVLSVETIEPCLPLWERLGFERLAAVPEDGPLAFVMLGRGSVMVMYQTHASLDADAPALGRDARTSVQLLYCQIDDLDATMRALDGLGLEVAVPERTTFYGAREVSVRDAGGHIVTFAQSVREEG